MKTVSISQRVTAPANTVWDIIRAGGDVDLWFAPVTSCRLEGQGVGARRTCTINGRELTECIETIDESSRLFQYRIIKQDLMPIRNILGTMRVTSTGPADCDVLWFANFELDDESGWPAIREGMEVMYRTGIAGLQARASQK